MRRGARCFDARAGRLEARADIGLRAWHRVGEFTRVAVVLDFAVMLAVSFVVSSVVAFAYFRWGRWREKQLFAKPEPAPASD